jgi:hypothetical protein
VQKYTERGKLTGLKKWKDEKIMGPKNLKFQIAVLLVHLFAAGQMKINNF